MPLRQTGPGHYEASFDAPQIGTYLVNVLQKKSQGPDGATVIGLSTPYSPEYKTTQPNRFLMTQLAQAGMGRPDPPAGSVFGGDRPEKFSPRDMVPWLVLAAMLLLPFDIAVRRLAIDPADLRRVVGAVTARRGTAPRARAPVASRSATPELGRLLDRKEGAVEPRPVRADAAAEPDAAPAAARSSVRVATAPPDRPVSRTLGTTSTAEVAQTPVGPEAVETTDGSVEEAGMSRLMAAKLRARQRNKPEDDA